ncbi:hypothetical protein Lal_00008383 [Lupinus albus]|nr:hypothetical protein Lal_00008383 [Lupinus albus]
MKDIELARKIEEVIQWQPAQQQGSALEGTPQDDLRFSYVNLPPAIFLMGPTASGKTAATIALAQHFPVEIISVDSALVYRGMDIGTAKPDAETLRQAPHHLIDSFRRWSNILRRNLPKTH